MKANVRTYTLIFLGLLIVFFLSYGAVYSLIKIKGLSVVVNTELFTIPHNI